MTATIAPFIFEADSLATPDELRITNFAGSEGLSQLFHFGLELVGAKPDIDFARFINKPAALTILGGAAGSPVRHKYFGLVAQFEQTGRLVNHFHYRLELVPRLWLLTLRQNCRIFQNMNVQEIVQKVFDDAGFGTDDFRFALNGTPSPREYCVQYRESDFNFISRLLEDEGIFYFFEHNGTKEVLVMADSPSVHAETAPQHEVQYHDPTGQVPREVDTISEIRYRERVLTNKVALKDFNYDMPQTNLLASSQLESGEAHELYDYPGGFQFVEQGSPLTRRRNEEIETNRKTLFGVSDCRSFYSGYRFKLASHYRSALNEEYLLTRLSHSGGQGASGDQIEGGKYSNQFECIPMSQTFRPPRRTARPRVAGTQTATVVGQSSEQLYMDDKGRAKVKFHWDRDDQRNEQSSCWVRVSHGYAGAGHGIQFHPLIGDEVIVDFLEGDPDRPIIIGRVYNGDNMPPLKPEERIQNIILTPYQHRLIFDDQLKTLTLNTGGSETMHFADAEDSTELGNQIKLSTANGHSILLAKGSQLKGLQIQTEAGHTILLQDDPNPGILIRDKDQKLRLAFDTNNQIIELINEGTAQIDVKCESGTINIAATDINIDASSKVKITGGAEISLSAPEIKITGDSKIEAKAPEIKIEADMKLEEKGMQVKIEAGTQLEAKGQMVKVEAGAMGEVKAGAILTIQGALVKIN